MRGFIGFFAFLFLPEVLFAADPAWQGNTMKSFHLWQNHHAEDILSYSVDYSINGPGAIRLQCSPSAGSPAPRQSEISLQLGGVDWSPYDRLVIYTVNQSQDVSFAGKVSLSDEKKENFTAWLYCVGGNLITNVLSLDEARKKIDLANVEQLFFSAPVPKDGMDVTLSGFLLLKPGEVLPELSAKSIRQLQGLSQARLERAEKALTEAEAAIASVPNVAFQEKLRAEKEVLANELAAGKNAFGQGAMSLPAYQLLAQRCYNLPARIERLRDNSYFAAASLFYAASAPAAVGHTGATDQLAPHAMAYTLSASPEINVSAARNETEAFQMAVLPLGRDLDDIHVVVGALESTTGETFPAEAVTVSVVGAVEMKNRTYFETDYVGFYADPILDFMESCAVPDRRLQSFLVRVRVPEEQEPGEYCGTLWVNAGGHTLREFSLRLTVWPFSIPDKAPLPIAFFLEKDEQSVPYWEGKKEEYADFLASYYLDFNPVFSTEILDFPQLEEQKERGGLTAFCLYTVKIEESSSEGFEQEIENIRPIYEDAKAHDLLEYAYFSCCSSEKTHLSFNGLNKMAERLKKEFPEVPVMAMSDDLSCKETNDLSYIDIWCSRMLVQSPKKVEAARKAGCQIWWQVNNNPYCPDPIFLLENRPDSGRVFAGVLAAKFRPDGLLYDNMTETWEGNSFLSNGPLTDWDVEGSDLIGAEEKVSCHGGGLLVYPDADRNLLASLRLENFRDGLDDLHYILLAEKRLQELKAKTELTNAEKMWIARAEHLLPIPESIVRNQREYATGSELIAYRNALGMLLADDPQWQQQK